MTQSNAHTPTADWDPSEEQFPDGLRSPEWVAQTDALRERCPVAYSDRFGGFWTLSRYADVAKAALDNATFQSGRQFVRMPDLLTVPGMLNPPEHSVYRRLLNRFFSAKNIARLQAPIDRFIAEGLDPMLERGHGDIVRELCQPLPARALAALLNLDDSAYVELVQQFRRFDETGWNPDAINAMIFSVFSEHIQRLITQRRKSPLDPEIDLISAAIEMQVDGRPISDETVVGIGVSIIGAGHSTTADALSSAIYRLACDPNLQARLRHDSSLVDGAVEEFLRLDTPLPELTRTTSANVEVAGVAIPQGSLVALNFGSANLDEAQFEHPTACIVDRSERRHLAFGHGIHKCAGAPLARLELTQTVRTLLARTQSFALDGAPQPAPGLVLNGLAALPLRLVPA